MKALDVVAMVLLIVGGLNWGLVGLANFDLVSAITGAGGEFGTKNGASNIVYVLVGLAALYEALGFRAMQRRWSHPRTATA